MRRFGTLPLMFQPGERWLYNTGSEILGVVLARASGQPLEKFLDERIFQPLGMKDTAFSVPASKRGRFTTSFGVDGREVYDAVDGQWSQPPAFPSCGAGLVSTVDDCLAFAQMMLNQGTHGKDRLLSRLSVEAMTTDQLTPAQKAVSGFFPEYFRARGWGFGNAVITQRDDVFSVPGRFGWDGGLGTTCWTDPKEKLIGILMTQRAGFPQLTPAYVDFWTSAYQAIDG